MKIFMIYITANHLRKMSIILLSANKEVVCRNESKREGSENKYMFIIHKNYKFFGSRKF